MNEYALYKGDRLLGVGTIKELAKQLDIKRTTLRFYMSPAYARRCSEKNGRRLVKLEREK